MKKRIALLLAALLAVGSLTACGGNAGNNDAEGGNDAAATVNVGLGLHTDMAYSSKEASDEGNGNAQADLTVAAVTVDAEGKIASVKFDCIQVKTFFDATGTITADSPAEFKTKRELGYDYNMKGTSAGIGVIEGGAEWFEQADALEAFCIGKTIEEVKAAVGADGKPADENLLLGCTMTVSGFVVALDKAVAEASTGVYTASATDTLNVGLVAEVSNPASATAEEAGAATAYGNFVAVTADAEGKITACILDSVQAKFAWDATGKFTSDLTVDTTTKYDLKEEYGMKGVSASNGVIVDGGEWYEQADAFMSYVKGMTAEQVKSIAVDESGYPTDENLTLGCTMKIKAYISAVDKALAK